MDALRGEATGGPGTHRPKKLATTDPATMTAGAINKELDKLDERRSVLGQMMIDAGRGHERPSEYLKMSDPISSEIREAFQRQSDLRVEISMRWGPNAPSRLPTEGRNRKFLGPRKKKGE